MSSSKALDDVEDSDMDKRIAEMMVQDAKERQKQWGTSGYSAYLSDDEPDGPKRKTNKRFLTSMLRNVDTHNQALIREELEAAQRAQAEKERSSSRREEPSASARSSRLFGSAMQSASRTSRSSASTSDKLDKGKGRARDDDEDDRERRHKSNGSSRRRSRSREGERRHQGRDSDDPDSRYRSRRRSRSRSTSPKQRRRRAEEDEEERSSRRRRHRDGRERDDDEPRRHRHTEHRSRRDDERLSRISRKRSEEVDDKSRPDAEPPRSRPRSTTPVASISSREPEAAPPERNGSSKSPAKVSKAELVDMHPTELFLLQGTVSPPRSPSPPPEPVPRRRKRSLSPVARVRAPSHDDEDDLPRGTTRRPKQMPGPASKMDKYFDAAYDPRLDVSLADLTDPATGLILEGAFDDWGTMLELMKARKEYKKEKEIRDAEAKYQAQEAEEAKKERKRKAKEEEKDRKRRRKLGVESDEDDYGPQPASKVSSKLGAPAGPGMMGYRYVKSGGTREWDLGKEGDADMSEKCLQDYALASQQR